MQNVPQSNTGSPINSNKATSVDSKGPTSGTPQTEKSALASEFNNSAPQIYTAEELGIEIPNEFPNAAVSGPRQGFERPYTKELVIEAMQRLPLRISESLLNLDLPGLVYGHHEQPLIPIGSSFSTGLRYVSFIGDMKLQDESVKKLIFTKIILLDFPIEMGMGRESLSRKLSIFLPEYTFRFSPHPWNGDTKALFSDPRVISENARIAGSLSNVSFERLAKEGVLHEIGHLVWFLLPDTLKSEWTTSIYPMDPPPEYSGLYLRARLYAKENLSEFSQESFCDKWARFFLSEEDECLNAVGRTIRDIEISFMERVCQFFYEKLERGVHVHEVES